MKWAIEQYKSMYKKITAFWLLHDYAEWSEAAQSQASILQTNLKENKLKSIIYFWSQTNEKSLKCKGLWPMRVCEHQLRVQSAL